MQQNLSKQYTKHEQKSVASKKADGLKMVVMMQTYIHQNLAFLALQDHSTVDEAQHQLARHE